MAITVSDISALVARFGNEIVNEQANLAAPLRKEFKEHKEGGRVGIVNLKDGEVGHAWIADSGALGAKTNVTPVQLTYLPKFLYGKLGIPRGAATLASGEGEGINLVKEELESLGHTLGRQLELGYLGGAIETLSSAQATEIGAAGTTFTTTNPSKYRVGMYLEQVTAAGTAPEEYYKVTGVSTTSGSTSATITIERDVAPLVTAATGGNTPSATDRIFPVGASANAMTGYADVCSATEAAVYGSAASPSFVGNTKDVGGSLTRGDMRDMSTHIARRSGRSWDKLFMNSLNLQRYEEFMLDARRYITGKMDAVGGIKSEFEGKEICISENVRDDKIIFHNKEDVALHVFKDFVDDMDGGPAPAASTGLGHAQVDPSVFDYYLERWGAFELRVKNRTSSGELTGITG
jgi:hypothetical protein